MKPTIMTARITDQRLRLVNETLIASGGVDEVQIRFEFCSLWAGGGKVAVFYRDPSKVYHVPIMEDKATVPWEVLADEGYFYFGVMGVAGNVRTTEAIRVYVSQGAITVPTEESRVPTPDIYQQILAGFGVMTSRFDEAIAMRSTEGEVTWEITSGGQGSPQYGGYIKSTGAVAELDIHVSQLTVEPYETAYIDAFPDGFVPFGTTNLSYSDDFYVLVSQAEAIPEIDGMRPCIVIRNRTDKTLSKPQYYVQGKVPLASISIAELADIRVGADGRVYPTAGEAVRAAANQLGDLEAALDHILAIQAELLGGEG